MCFWSQCVCGDVARVLTWRRYGVELQPGGPTVLLRGHPDEILSLDEVKRYWKKPTRHVFEEMAADSNKATK